MNIKRLESRAQSISTQSWFNYLLLILITGLGAGFRFFKLGQWSFWIDEIFTINHALRHYGNLQLALENIPPATNWVPTSVILTAQALNLFAVSEWSARLASAVIGTLSIPVLYFPLKKIFGNQVTLIALLLLAVSPWHIEWSQTARFYTGLMLFYTLALIFYFYGLERDRPLYILIFMFLFYLATSERLFAVFLVPVVLGYLLLLKILPFERPPGFRARNLLLTLLPIAAAVSIEVLSLIKDGTSRFLGGFDWFFLYRLDDPFRLLSFIGFEVGVPLMCFSIFCGIYLVYKRSRAGLLLIVSAVVPIVLLLALNPFIFTKTRYIFMTLPSWIILGAVGIREILNETKSHGKILAVGLLFVFLADAAGSDLLYYQVNNGNRLDWKGAFSLVREQSQAGDELVTWFPEWEGYYWDQEILLWQDLDPEFVVSSGKRFWFILDDETQWGNTRMKSWMEENAELIKVLYLRRENDTYLKIYLYDPVSQIHTNGPPQES